jgi:Domain of unknown function (DUF6268)
VGQSNLRLGAGLAVVILGGGALEASAQSLVRPIPRADQYVLSGSALASFRELAAQEEAPELTLQTDARLFGEARPRGNLEGLDAAVDTQRMGWGAGVTRSLGEHDFVAIEGELESSFYNWTGSSALVNGQQNPFNDLYRARLAASHHHALGERLALLNGFEISLNGEDEAKLLEGLVVGGSTGLGWRAHEELEITAGVLVASRLEDDPLAIPYLGIDWRPSDALRLKAEGPRVRLDASLSEHWSLGFEALYAQRQFRLNETSGGESPVFRDETIDLKAELAYAFNPNARLTLSGGVSAWREFTFIADNGDKLIEAEQSKEPFVGLALQLSF